MKIKSLFLITVLLFILNPAFSQINGESSLEVNGFYHPTITLDDSEELPFRSSLGTRIIFSPIKMKYNKINIGLTNSLIFVSSSLAYNSVQLRGLAGFDLGLSFGYSFSQKFEASLTSAIGIAELNNSDNQEGYLSFALTPSFLLYEKNLIKLYLTTPLNIIYRKQLLSPTVGIGLNFSYDWKNKKSTN